MIIINNNTNYIINIRPVKAIEYKDQDPIIGRNVPNKTFEDAIIAIKTIKFSMNMEIDTQYNTDSIDSNFNRILKKTKYNVPVSIAGNIYKSSYKLTLDDTSSDCYVSVYPYRNGSKAVVHVDTILSSKNDRIDVGKKIDILKQKIASIVNN